METINKQGITIDFRQSTDIPLPTFTQYDTNILEITVNDNGQPAVLTDIGNIVANHKRPDGKITTRILEPVGNVITYQFGVEEMGKPGEGQLVLQFFKNNARRSTNPIKVYFTENFGPAFEDGAGLPMLQQLFVETEEVTKNAMDAGNYALEQAGLVAGTLTDAETALQTATEAAEIANTAATAAQQSKEAADTATSAATQAAQEATDATTAATNAAEQTTQRLTELNGVDAVQFKDRQDQFDQQLADTKKQEKFASNLKARIKKNFYNEDAINNIGDSISHGANAPDIPNDSYIGILRKMINAEFNNNSYGFTSMMYQMTNTAGTYTEIHEISMGNYQDWTYETTYDRLMFASYATTVNNSPLSFSVKKPFKYIRVYYEQNADGGEFEVLVNNVLVSTVNYTGTTKFAATAFIPITVTGAFTIILRKKSGIGKITFNGMGYYEKNDSVTLQNFARSGTRLSLIPNNVLDVICNAGVVIFSLGHNDNGDSTVTLDMFKQKIAYCKSIFQANNTLVVVNDLIYDSLATNGFKQELKKLSDDLGGLYINVMEDVWKTVRADVVTKGYTSDSSHPTPLGHQLIAEYDAKKLQLGVTSKKVAEKIESLTSRITTLETQANQTAIPWTYLTDAQLLNGWLNVLDTDNKYRVRYKKEGNTVKIKMWVKSGTLGSAVFNLPAEARPVFAIHQTQRWISTTGFCVATVNTSGDVVVSGTGMSEYHVNLQYEIV